MASLKIHTHYLEKAKLQYLRFDSPSRYYAFVEAQTKRLRSDNNSVLQGVIQRAEERIRKREDWYGTPAPNSLRDLERHHYFEKMALLDQIAPKIQKELESYKSVVKDQVLKRPVLTANSKGLGVFSFDRVMMGLYKLPYPADGSELEKLTHRLKMELGMDRVTSVKKTHLYFKDKAQNKPMLTLSVLAGGNSGVKGDALYYVGIAIALLTQHLEEASIAVAIDVLIGTSISDRHLLSVIRVKSFEAPLDINQLLVLSSDAKYFRFNGFKGLIALADYMGISIPRGLGKIENTLARAYIDIEKESLLFNQSYSIQSAKEEVTRIIETYIQRKNNENY